MSATLSVVSVQNASNKVHTNKFQSFRKVSAIKSRFVVSWSSPDVHEWMKTETKRWSFGSDVLMRSLRRALCTAALFTQLIIAWSKLSVWPISDRGWVESTNQRTGLGFTELTEGNWKHLYYPRYTYWTINKYESSPLPPCKNVDVMGHNGWMVRVCQV